MGGWGELSNFVLNFLNFLKFAMPVRTLSLDIVFIIIYMHHL